MKTLADSAGYRIRASLRALKRLAGLRRAGAPDSLPKKYVETLRNVEACSGSLNGKKILEAGSDVEGRFLRYLTSQRAPAEAVGVNPVIAKDIEEPAYSVKKEDARKLTFRDNVFDVIVSIAAFQHFRNFDVALAEMYRVLRPGGYLFAEFAPIWSGMWGHQIWFYHGGELRDWRNTPLPPYAHLLMREEELRSWLSKKYRDDSLTTKILDYIYRSDDLNRLFFSDYERIVAESPFETLFLVGFNDLPFPRGYEVADARTVLNELHNSYPDKTGFGYHGITMLLTKS